MSDEKKVLTRGAKVNADITALLKAKNSLLWIVTPEERRAEAAIIEAAAAAKYGVNFWDCATGISDEKNKPVGDMKDPLAAIQKIRTTNSKRVYVMRDLHKWLQPDVLRLLRTTARELQDNIGDSGQQMADRAIIVLSPSGDIPIELSGSVTVIEYPIPDRAEMANILETVIAASDPEGKKNLVTPETRDAAIDSAVGLTADEATNCYARSLVTARRIDPVLVAGEKKRIIAREKVLTWYDADPRGMDAIGGLEALKEWLRVRHLAFSPEARKYGVPLPKGVFLCGLSGCLAGDTELLYLRGKRCTGRKLSIRELYLKFNGQSRVKPWTDLTMPTFLQSLGEDGVVFYNRVIAVFESGIKPLVRLDFSDGSHIRCTADHPIATPGQEFIEAGTLKRGDKVLAKGSMKLIKGRRPLCERPPRVIVNTKYHPNGYYKDVSGYEYKRVARAVLVVEAHMNQLDYSEFVHCLKHNEEASSKLKFLPKGVEVHHIDEDTMNDDIGNLMVLTKAEHAKGHYSAETFKRKFIKEIRVVSTRSDGEEMTYDIQMEPPANNFAANGVIVHNTGKSLTAKCISAAWQMPLLRLDLGALRSKFVGESEANIRKALRVAEAVSPAIVWIDEIEKGFAGASGLQGDGGVAADALGSFLTWMQERQGSTFVVVTANGIEGLPPELLRKGRFDELFFLDLPIKSERVEILKIAIRASGRQPEAIDHAKVAEACAGFVGSEVAAIVPDAMFEAFADGSREITTKDLVDAAKRITPLSKTAAATMDRMRDWAKGRARKASTAVEEQGNGQRRIDLDDEN